MTPTELAIEENVCLSVGPRDLPTAAVVPTETESVFELIQGAADSIRELMSPCLTVHQLNDARFALMRAIRSSPSGECSQSDLARCLKQSEANVSTLLDRMRGDELVSREKSPFDRRRSVVRLSARGEALLSQAEIEYAARAQRLLSSFAVYEVPSFREQLRQVIAVCGAELDHSHAVPAVAGRIGDATNENENTSEGTEIRHAQAG